MLVKKQCRLCWCVESLGSMDPAQLVFYLLWAILPMCYPSPLATPFGSIPNSKFCKLPGPLLSQTGPGEYKLLEDCSNITMFETLPVPAPNKDLGVHPYVCCPRDNSAYVCFDTDPWCPSHIGTFKQTTGSIVSENICPNRSAECINFKKCEGILNQGGDSVAHVDVCGWDEGDKALKVCCPTGAEQGRKNYKPHPRYSIEPETPYPCDNKADYVETGMCETWKNNGGCDTDKHFYLDPNSSEDTVSSWEMFHFMMMSCMKTCGRCRAAGASPNTVPNACQDEHPRCGIWTKNNMCVINPWFMGHTCRESCGVCGFLSPFDKTIQNIEGNFYTYKQNVSIDCEHKNIQAENLSLCDATIISDRWAITEQKCHSSHPNIQTINTKPYKTIRSGQQNNHLGVPSKETLELKKVYKHPTDHTISVAVLELGRRIPYDFEKYRDKPACLAGLPNNRWIKCILMSSYEFKNNHDQIQEHCKRN